MAAEFPTKVKNFNSVIDLEQDALQDEIVAIETELLKAKASSIIEAADSAKLGGVAASAFLQASGIWADYEPVLTAVTVNPTLGDGVLTGRYVQFGKLVIGIVHYEFGSTSVAGTGAYTFTYPVTPKGSLVMGIADILDLGTKDYQGLVRGAAGGFRVTLHNANTLVTEAAPMTWAAGDTMDILLVYEAN